MIQDTTYNLKLHLQRVDEKMAQITVEDTNTSDISIDLKDERAVTKQCLRICQDARSYIGSLSNRQSPLLQEVPQNSSEDHVRDPFEAELLTRQALDENRDSFAAIIGQLRKRLESLVQNEDLGEDSERLRLQADITISKQCLDVCKVASEFSRQKIYRIGEVIADGDSDQVVVNTLADVFDIKRALSKGNSAQLVGSMTAESLRYLTEKRYSSRFGAVVGDSDHAEAGITSSPSVFEVQKSNSTSPSETGNRKPSPGPKTRPNRPSPNEMRKRVTDDVTD